MNDIKFSELPPGTYFIARQNKNTAWHLFLLISNFYNEEIKCYEYVAVDQNSFLEIDSYLTNSPWNNLDRIFIRLL